MNRTPHNTTNRFAPAWLSAAAILTSTVIIGFGALHPAPQPAGLVTASTASFASAESAASAVSPDQQEMISAALRGAHFVPNEGQWADETVIYGFRTAGIDVAFRESTLTMHMQREEPRADRDQEVAAVDPGAAPPLDHGLDSRDEPTEFERLTLEVTFPGSNDVTPRAADAQAATFNYFVGDDESQWASEVPSYSTVIYENLYDGIDLHVMGADGGVLKYEFRCAPGSDHTQIQVRYEGIDSLRIEEETGDLLIDTSFGTLRDGAPVVWEGDFTPPDERIADHTVPARFETLDSNTYTVALLSERDPSRPLVIDPEIEWMKYLGGSGLDVGLAIAVDDAGNALVTGWTRSPDFAGAANSPYSAPDEYDVYALKVSPSGKLQWMTYLGGNDEDRGHAIAVNDKGYALVAGHTQSDDFAGANNSYPGGFRSAFTVKVSPSGELQWMTYLGGSSSDFGKDIAVDNAGHALVAGRTHSPDFAGANNACHSCTTFWDAFALKVSPSGELQWMKFLGGSSGSDRGMGIAVDDAGYALVAGRTTSHDFTGAINSCYGCGWPNGDDAFALKVSPSGDLQWMIYLGGSEEDDRAWGIAVDGAGNALVTGYTTSVDFAGAINEPYSAPDEWDAFALKVSPSGDLQWMIYLGGSEEDDRAWGIAIDGAGNALVAGNTGSPDFAGAINAPYSAPDAHDAFILKLKIEGTDPCPWDFNGDGVVDGADLGQLLANWGACADCDDCPWDVTGDCVVDGADLGQLLANWGDCPEPPPPPTGACCIGEICEELTFSECNAAGGEFLGTGTDCVGDPCEVGCGDPSAGDCCEQNPTPYCDDQECCELICGQDPFCCGEFGGHWDSACANQANQQCTVCQ